MSSAIELKPGQCEITRQENEDNPFCGVLHLLLFSKGMPYNSDIEGIDYLNYKITSEMCYARDVRIYYWTPKSM